MTYTMSLSNPRSVSILVSLLWLVTLASIAAPPGLAEEGKAQRPEDLFALRLISPDAWDAASPAILVVQAYRPHDFEPIAGLELSVLVEKEGAESKRLDGSLDEKGTAVIALDLPDDWKSAEEIEVTVSATHRGVTRSVETTLWRDAGSRTLLSTDRHLYQPGQEAHLRGLWLDGAGQPLRHAEVELEIADPERRVVTRVERRTSDLGIASFDWAIPASARAGDYRIEAEPGGWYAARKIRIRPYEPARLLIRARGSSPFFLPGEPGEVDVEVTLPDGTPLTGVAVSLVPRTRRRSTCCEGAAPGEEGQVPRRFTDAEGRARLSLELASEFEALDRRAFRDLEFEVQAEDPLTGRSETAPLELRISRHPVHLHLLGELREEPLPSRPWVLAQDAAGEPRPGLQLELRRILDDGQTETVGRPTTDHHGIASLAPWSLDAGEDYQLVALDGERLVGRLALELWEFDTEMVLEVERPLRDAGEPLEFTIHTREPFEQLWVAIVARGEVVHGQRVEGVEGSKTLSVAFDERLVGPVGITAIRLDPRAGEDSEPVGANAFALYPKPPGRELALSTDREVYRPGEKVRLSVEHEGDEGPSAVAVAVVDRASEARAASEGLGRGPALLAGGGGLSRLGNPLAWRLDTWRFEELEKLDRLPAEERRQAAAQEMARALLAGLDGSWHDEDLDHPFRSARRDFASYFATQGGPIERAFAALEAETEANITDAAGLLSELERRGVELGRLEDPWGSPYRPEVELEGWLRHLRIYSNGWDQEPGTRDDFVVWSASWPFARRLGKALEEVAEQRYETEGRFVTSIEEAHQALADAGIDPPSLVDPWGNPYYLRWRLDWRFELLLMSPGSDGERQLSDDDPADLVVWWIDLSPTERYRVKLRAALADPAWDAGFEGDDASFRRRLAEQGVRTEDWLDPWGQPFYFTFRQRLHVGSGTSWQQGGKTLLVSLWTLGADGRRDTEDDRRLSTVIRPSGGGPTGLAIGTRSELEALGKGVVEGRVVLSDGSPIPGVSISATAMGDTSGHGWSALSNVEGYYVLPIPAGLYWLEAQLDGFSDAVVPRLLVEPGSRHEVDWVMEVSSVEETIVVTAESPQSSAPVLTEPKAPEPAVPTPRLRHDFRETLFWLAEGRTDASGRLELAFPLADNLTRWSVAALASDGEGRVSAAKHELRVRQPFAVEPDLPPLLTVGDTLAVPVVVNNATERSLEVELSVTESEEGARGGPPIVLRASRGPSRHDLWRSFSTPGEQALELLARAAASEGGEPLADAVRKTTRVEPDGARKVVRSNHLARGEGTIELDLPAAALDGTGRLELVVYEGFDAHLSETLEGLARRPVGCAEQVTSTAWANLFLLERRIAAGVPSSSAALRARRHLELALERLASLQRRDGGFGYWSGFGDSDPALTAYVLDFLLHVEKLADEGEALATEAAPPLLEVDPESLRRAVDYLVAWRARPAVEPASGSGAARRNRTLALVADVLARHAEWKGSKPSRRAAREAIEVVEDDPWTDPYALALVSSAYLALDQVEAARKIARRLPDRAERTRGTLSWASREGTPFYGWGRSGRLETTALVLRGLVALRQHFEAEERAVLDAVIESGLSYLLLQKDGDGLWASTQSTLQVLRTLGEVFPPAGSETASGEMTIRLDGELLGSDSRIAHEGQPTRWIVPLERGRHQLDVVTDSETQPWRLIQARLAYVVPWDDPRAEQRSEALRFAVDCGPLELTVGEQALCRVELGRKGRRGGMVIAEIGLPPGAEVDRAALLALQSGGKIQRSESWPGKLVLYLWPGLQTLELEIPWRPRMALRGKSQPSRLYDYYNPDEEIVLAPAAFEIESRTDAP